MDSDYTTASNTSISGGGHVRSNNSDDSSFYGDQKVKDEYESRARDIDTCDYWRVQQWNLQVKAVAELKRNPLKWPERSKKRRKVEEEGDEDKENLRTEKKTKVEDARNSPPDLAIRLRSIEPFNPLEGSPTALQLGESIEDFLARLDPRSADTSQPWIRCANFHSSWRPAGEKIAEFRQIGKELLDSFLSKRHDLEDSFYPPKAEGVITRMLSKERKQLEDDVLQLAERNGITSGKWLLFPNPIKVFSVWSTVVKGTVDGRLGSSAKVATKPNVRTPGDDSQVICVYTENFRDEKDIKRVLDELIRLGLAQRVLDPMGSAQNLKNHLNPRNQIYYKPDAYSHLDLMSQNEYKIKTTLWSTTSLLMKMDVRK